MLYVMHIREPAENLSCVETRTIFLINIRSVGWRARYYLLFAIIACVHSRCSHLEPFPNYIALWRHTISSSLIQWLIDWLTSEMVRLTQIQAVR